MFICFKYQTIVKYFMKPSSCRIASKVIRKYGRMSMETHQPIIREILDLDQNRPQSPDEWNVLRDKLLRLKKDTVTKVNIDAIILGTLSPTQLDVGKSYIKYLKESGIQPKTGTMLILLKLYYNASKAGFPLTKSDQQDIIDMYKHFKEKFPVFDSTLSEYLIYGLLSTNDWRKSIELMDSMKYLSKPNLAVYSAIIQRAAEEQDESLYWDLLNEMVADSQISHHDVYVSYLRCFCEKDDNTFTQNINKMLTFIQDNEILLSYKTVTEFQRAFQNFGYTCATTSVTKQGRCHSCEKYLHNIQHITDDEFNQLSNHLIRKVFIGNDVFRNSTPKEVASFTAFIEETKPFDVVIDGLNVAYSTKSTHPSVASKMLAGVVKHFADQKRTVLVIGRKHMERWPKAQMQYIGNNSHLFLTENLSEDDPFVLYAALKSGPKTNFVSRDLMRNHAFKLDKNLKIIFRRWQLLHQYMLEGVYSDRKVIFVKPIEFDMNAQQVDGCWHIPYDDDKTDKIEKFCTIPQNSFDLRMNWLCVSNVGNR